MQNVLNPQLWTDTQLDPQVRERLLSVADRFWRSLDIEAQPADIILTGSMAGYNWTPKSDIDLHIVLDFAAVDEDARLVKDYMLAKKGLWNDQHHIRIKGYPVEVYAQDKAEPHVAPGMYSLLHDAWLKTPVQEAPQVDEATVNKKAEQLAYDIDEAIKAQDLPKLETLSERLRTMRQDGLAHGGEYSVGNQVFKALRKSGHMEALSRAKLNIVDTQLSLSSKQGAPMSKPIMTDADLLKFCGVTADRIPAKVAPDYALNRNADPEETETGRGADDDAKGKETTTHEAQERLMGSKKRARMLPVTTNSMTAEQAQDLVWKLRDQGIPCSSAGRVNPNVFVEESRLEDARRVLNASVKTADYNGWKNYETWAVALHLDNDEGTQNMVRDWVKDLRSQESEQVKEGIWTAEEALEFNLADQIKDFIEEQRPEVEGLYHDLLDAALSEVDWHEVAEHYIEKDADISRNSSKVAGQGRHETVKKPGDSTYSAEWSGVSYAPHARGKVCPACGEQVHSEAGEYYCPKCDNYVKAVNKQGAIKATRKKADAGGPDDLSQDDPDAAVTPTTPEFDEEGVKAQMALALGVDADDVEVKDGYVDGAFEVEAAGNEYTVMADEDAAEAEALRRVKEDLENEPEMFIPSFIQQYLTIGDTDRRIIAGEESDNRYEDMRDNEVEKEYEREIGDAPQDSEGEPDYEAMKEALKERAYDEIYEALKDPVQYFCKDQGTYTEDELMDQSFISIDVEAAAEEAISVDGFAHFLSTYDGSTDTTAAGFCYWRTN